MNWTTVRHAFDYNGSWRDIYVFHTDLKLWQALLDFLREQRGYVLEYSRDGQSAELPTDVAEIFTTWKAASPL
jgi:hypothetical protein